MCRESIVKNGQPKTQNVSIERTGLQHTLPFQPVNKEKNLNQLTYPLEWVEVKKRRINNNNNLVSPALFSLLVGNLEVLTMAKYHSTVKFRSVKPTILSVDATHTSQGISREVLCEKKKKKEHRRGLYSLYPSVC